MNELGRRFINRYQGGFPLEEQPYVTAAAELGVEPEVLINEIGSLLEDGTLSRFGPLYDVSAMGGSLTLAALSVPEKRYDEVTGLVNALPEVAHNYEREHELNMWFVIAAESPRALRGVIERIEQEANLPVYDFPKLQTFYLGLWIEIGADGGVATRPVPGPLKQGGMIVDDLDCQIVRASQQGLPLVTAPYTEIASRCGCDTGTVIGRMRHMLERGVIRRIGAIPNHYRLGLRANGMSVWDVDDEYLQDLGARVGRLDFVSHCYERPRHPPRWPYNLFAMVHGQNRNEVNDKVMQIADLLGRHCRAREVLFSTRILKKTGLRLVA
jgi:DNA-binding Lrp family transcriptional regulator